MPGEDNDVQVLNRNVLVPLGAVIATLTLAAGIGLWWRGEEMEAIEKRHQQQISQVQRDNEINAQLKEMNVRLASIEKGMKESAGTNWTRGSMKAWLDELRFRNPDLDVPRVDDID